MPNSNGNGGIQIKLNDPTEAQLALQAMMGNQSLPEVVDQAAQQGIFGQSQLMADAQVPAPPQEQAAAGSDQPAFDPNKGAIVANVTGMAPLTGAPQYGSQTQSALPAVPLPAATGTAVPPAQPWAPQAAGPTTEQTLAGAAQALPTSESALGAIPTAPQPTQAGAVQPTRGQRFLHGLGQVLGTALGAVSPGVAAQIPGTPLGKIVAANRAIAQQRAQADTLRAQAEGQIAATQAATAPAKAEADVREALSRAALDEATAKRMGNTIPITLANGQQVWLNEKDASTVLGRQVTAGATLGAAGIRAKTQEDINREKIAQDQKKLDEDYTKFQQSQQYKTWKTKLDDETKERVAQISGGKAPAAMIQTAEFAGSALNRMADAKDAMAQLRASGVMGTLPANKVEDWIFGKGLVDPSLDPNTRALIGKLRAALSYTSTAAMRAHTGRTSQEIYNDFKNTLGAGQDWNALDGAIDETEKMMGDYAQAASTENLQRIRAGQPIATGTPAAPAPAAGARGRAGERPVYDSKGNIAGYTVDGKTFSRRVGNAQQ